MAESMKDYEKELEESMKTIEEGDILTGTVISVDEKEVILDLKYYAEGSDSGRKLQQRTGIQPEG